MAKKQETEPTDHERKLLQSLLYDSLLSGQPIVSYNVRSALVDLLIHLGRPKLGELVKNM